MTKASKPKWQLERTLRAGAEMLALALQYRARLEPRLEAALIDGFKADLEALRGDTTKAGEARVTTMAATLSQDQALAEGAAVASAHREAIKRAFPRDKRIQRSFGVGLKVTPHLVKSVATALETLERGMTDNPEQARAAGLLPADLDEIRKTHAALIGADAAQEQQKASAKTATAQRIATHLRVESAMDKLAGIAALVFRTEPAVAARFHDALPTKPAARAKAAAPA